MQSASGVGPIFCSDSGGTTYRSDPSRARDRTGLGELFRMDAELLTCQTPIASARPVKPPGWASSPAIELRKYSVPLFAVWYALSGTFAGQTVKPGTRVEPLARNVFSNCTTWTVAAPAASARLSSR